MDFYIKNKNNNITKLLISNIYNSDLFNKSLLTAEVNPINTDLMLFGGNIDERSSSLLTPTLVGGNTVVCDNANSKCTAFGNTDELRSSLLTPTLVGGNTKNNKSTSKKYVTKLNIKNVSTYKSHYIKISQNQLQILDALLNDGGYKKYVDSDNNLRFSEHSGIFDFNKSKLERVIISGETNREDDDDTDILLPQNMKDALDYDYIFHTHPPTPFAGARAVSGILYEFPSISDLSHFAYHYNEGHVQGSMIIAPEGIYIIRMKIHIYQIEYPTDYHIEKLERLQLLIQKKAIQKYGKYFDGEKGQSKYYNEVISDKKYIKLFNRIVKKYYNKNMQILYFPRQYDSKTNKWIIKHLYIKIKEL